MKREHTAVAIAEVVPEGDDTNEIAAVPMMVAPGEIDVQIHTAKRFPRSVRGFLDRATMLATLDEETAEACMYALPRAGKTIEGPSARFGEIVASTYQNLRIEGRPTDDDGKFVTSRGTAWDIENNVLIAFEVKRRVVDSKGRRYSDDMVVQTQNAATSIAIRNAILKMIPKAWWVKVYDQARKVAIGDATTLSARRSKMLDYFVKMGVPNDHVFAVLGVKGIEDVTLDHLGTMNGIKTAIKEGDLAVDEAFATQAPEVTPSDKPKPEYYDEFIAMLERAAGMSAKALQETFKAAHTDVRVYLTSTDSARWNELKARAKEKAER